MLFHGIIIHNKQKALERGLFYALNNKFNLTAEYEVLGLDKFYQGALA